MTEQEWISRILDMTPILYRVCYAQLSQMADREDAVQEALRRAWEKRHTLRQDAHLQTWVIRILLNECHRIQRRNAHTLPVAEVQRVDSAADADALLRDALRSLDEKYRLPILLHYIEGYGVSDVARMLHVPPGTVKSRMRKGRTLLRQMLQEEVFEG